MANLSSDSESEESESQLLKLSETPTRDEIHSYFVFNKAENKNQCKTCSTKIAGNFPTNLKRHLKSKHVPLREQYIKTEQKSASGD